MSKLSDWLSARETCINLVPELDRIYAEFSAKMYFVIFSPRREIQQPGIQVLDLRAGRKDAMQKIIQAFEIFNQARQRRAPTIARRPPNCRPNLRLARHNIAPDGLDLIHQRADDFQDRIGLFKSEVMGMHVVNPASV